MSLINQLGSILRHGGVGRSLQPLLIIVGIGMGTLGFAGEEASSAQATENSPPQLSTFTIPMTVQEGRDPFFPLSKRVYGTVQPDDEKVSIVPAKLVLKGISGTTNRPLALINNQTFAIGDELDVSTSTGRVKVKCLDIKGMTATIRAQGRVQVLTLRETLRAEIQPAQPPVGKDL